MTGVRVAFPLIFLLPATGTLAAQQEPRSFVRLEVGRADIHRASSTGAVIGLRLGRRADAEGIARLDLGASYSGADEGYVALDVGGELRPLAKGRFTPIVGIGVGVLREPEFSGEVLRGTLAIEVEVSVRVAIRLGTQLGQHGGARGPNTIFLGIESRGRAH